MDDKEALQVLMDLLKKNVLNPKEKEAVREAIGILSWTSLAESRIKDLKAKKDREMR